MAPKVCYLDEVGRFRTVGVTLLGDSPHLAKKEGQLCGLTRY